MLRRFAGALLFLVACNPDLDRPPRHAKPPPCPPPPEPALQAVVVGTIGKMHLVESRYPLSKLGDVMAAFKPDLVLVSVRVDPYREGRLEDGSFEMTYAEHFAKQRGIPVEPIDWFRVEDLEAPLPALDPFDVTEIEKREAEVLSLPRVYTFEQANGAELAEKVFLAERAQARYRGGSPIVTRRHAWMQHLTASAVLRHGKPKRVLAFVDVIDRPSIASALETFGYDARNPVELVAKAKEVAIADMPSDLLDTWKKQLARVHERSAKASDAERKLFAERERVLDVVVEKKAACCVTQSALAPK
jgi:hypothetical protein